MYKLISRISNVLFLSFCVAVVLALGFLAISSKPLNTAQQRKVEWLRNEKLVGLRQGDFLVLEGDTYLVADAQCRSLVLRGPGSNSSETVMNQKTVCLGNPTEALNLAYQMQRPNSAVITHSDPGWQANAAWYWLQ